jgi:hypothetical protein
MTEALRSALKKLRLSGLLESLEVRLHEAASHHLNHLEFLELILQDDEHRRWPAGGQRSEGLGPQSMSPPPARRRG